MSVCCARQQFVFRYCGSAGPYRTVRDGFVSNCGHTSEKIASQSTVAHEKCATVDWLG